MVHNNGTIDWFLTCHQNEQAALSPLWCVCVLGEEFHRVTHPLGSPKSKKLLVVEKCCKSAVTDKRLNPNVQGPISQNRFRETLKWGQLSVFHFRQTGKSDRRRGVTPNRLTKRSNFNSGSAAGVRESVNLTWSGAGLPQQILSFSVSSPSYGTRHAINDSVCSVYKVPCRGLLTFWAK